MTCLIDRANGCAWPWIFRGEPHFVPLSPACLTDDTEAEIEAVCAGAGFGRCAAYLVRPYVQQRRLVRLLPSLEPEPWRPHVYRPRPDATAYPVGGTTNAWRSSRTQRRERSGTPVRFYFKPAITTRIVSVWSIKCPKSGFSRSIAASIHVNAMGDRNTVISQYVTACRKD
ncbi:hypothetical protein [Burkholderia sp. Ed8]|uniref:hypothetical protein n=1 Tax=Burkholderia sp. Ed8 TaxID=3112957 RepID=UPI00345DA78F